MRRPGTPRLAVLPQSFWDRVELVRECWIWRGYRTAPSRKGRKRNQGYGRYWFKGVKSAVHRLIWILLHGETEQDVLHTCDNRACLCPQHLFLGNDLTNALDKNKKGRGYYPGTPGEQHPQSKITTKDVALIHKLVRQGETYVNISKRLPIGPQAVGKIARRERWKSVGL